MLEDLCKKPQEITSLLERVLEVLEIAVRVLNQTISEYLTVTLSSMLECELVSTVSFELPEETWEGNREGWFSYINMKSFHRISVSCYWSNGKNTRLDQTFTEFLRDHTVFMQASWPKAIHEGNGTSQLFITKNANENQRQAIVNIFTGKAKGDGPFAIFSSAFKYIVDFQYVEINAKVNGRKSSSSVSGILDVQVENFINPVTGEEKMQKFNCQKDLYSNSQKQQRLK